MQNREEVAQGDLGGQGGYWMGEGMEMGMGIGMGGQEGDWMGERMGMGMEGKASAWDQR